MDSTVTIAQWVNDYTEVLYRWAAYRLNNDKLAQELVQDTFLTAHRGLSTSRTHSEPRTWLLGILNAKIAHHHREQHQSSVTMSAEYERYFFDETKEWRADRRPGAWAGKPGMPDDAAMIEVLGNSLDDLPEQWAVAVRLRYLSAMDTKDICDELNITQPAFWQIMHRARLSLRQRMEEKWFNNGHL